MSAALKNPFSHSHAAEISSEFMDFLQGVTLFSEIKDSPEALKILASLMREKDFSPRTNIVSEGELGSEMYFLISGQASVYKKTMEGDAFKVFVLSDANKPFFGEGSLLDEDARSATIQADTRCRCLVFDRQAFNHFAQEHPKWALPILKRVAMAVMSRLRKTNNDLMLLYDALVHEVRGD